MTRKSDNPRSWRNPRNHSIKLTNIVDLFVELARQGNTVFLVQSEELRAKLAFKMRDVFETSIRVHQARPVFLETRASATGELSALPWHLETLKEELASISESFARITGCPSKIILAEEMAFPDRRGQVPVFISCFTMKKGDSNPPDGGDLGFYPAGTNLPPACKRNDMDSTFSIILMPLPTQ